MTEANEEALDLIRHLIDARHYKSLGPDAAKAIVQDFKTLKTGLTEAMTKRT